MNPTTANIIRDKTVSELQTAIPGEFGFSMPFEIAARPLPDFDQIQAAETTLIQVASAPNIELTRGTRGIGRMAETGINQTAKIGIGVVKLLKKNSTGQPDQPEFDELESLVETICKWAHIGVDGFRGQVASVALPAWYDFSKAVSGVFLSVITVNYDTKF